MARHGESARRAEGRRSGRAGSRFRAPSKRIGDVLVALSPEEVRGICDGSSWDITAKEVRARLVAALERLSANRLHEVASTLDVPIDGVHDPIVALLEEDDGAGARWREGQGWTRKEVGRDALLAGLSVGKATEAQARLEVAFGLHIRPMIALVEGEAGLLSFPWRCWFDLEAAIVPWVELAVAEDVRAFDRFDPNVDSARSRLAAGSCVSIARTVAELLGRRKAWPRAFRITAATSSESMGIAGYLLERRHEGKMEAVGARIESVAREDRAAGDEVLVDGLMLLQPGLEVKVSVVEAPPRSLTVNELKHDSWMP